MTLIIPGVDYTFNVGQTANSSVYVPQLREEIIKAISILLVDIIFKDPIITIRFSDQIQDTQPLLSVINSHQGLNNIEKILEFNISPEIEVYAMVNFYDSRVTLPSNLNIPRRPLNITKALKAITEYIPVFLQEVRPTTNELSAIITEMSKSRNNLELLALWSLYRGKRDGVIE